MNPVSQTKVKYVIGTKRQSSGFPLQPQQLGIFMDLINDRNHKSLKERLLVAYDEVTSFLIFIFLFFKANICLLLFLFSFLFSLKSKQGTDVYLTRNEGKRRYVLGLLQLIKSILFLFGRFKSWHTMFCRAKILEINTFLK